MNNITLLLNVLAANNRLPGRVVIGSFPKVAFFDSDNIFHPSFPETVRSFLNVMDCDQAWLVNLDQLDDKSDKVRSIEINSSTTSIDYMSELNRIGTTECWIVGTDRFACFPENLRWIIYCEKGNEIALIGFRNAQDYEDSQAAINRIHAVSIDEAIANPPGFGFANFSEKWRVDLMKNYGW